MQFTEVFSDGNGDTHFRDIPVAMALRDFAPPSAPMAASAEVQTATGIFLSLPPGWDPKHHAIPIRQWGFMVAGHLRITVTDGAVAEFRPGDLFLLSDVEGRGHQSLVQGQEPVTLFMVGLAGGLA